MKFKPFEILKGSKKTGLVLIADHAGRQLPAEYGTLGLPTHEFDRHIAYDIGVEAVTCELVQQLNAPAVLANFSRLLIDANRNEDDPTLIRQIYDHTIVPGNRKIDTAERNRRLNQFFRPYQNAVRQTVDEVWATNGRPPLIVSLHSFTPQLGNGAKRPWHIGLLSDADRRATEALLGCLANQADLIIGDNEPYDGALKGDTLYVQASARGIAHVLIEIRQDLIADEAGAQLWGRRLAPHIDVLNQIAELHNLCFFGSRAGGLERTEP